MAGGPGVLQKANRFAFGIAANGHLPTTLREPNKQTRIQDFKRVCRRAQCG